MTTILLAEDEAILRELLTMELQEEGFSVTSVADGKQAMDALDRMTPHIVLLDLLMPVADGFAVLEFAKERGHSMPIIILSNLSTTDHRARCVSLGAADFLVKSNLEDGDVARTIRRHLDTAN